MASGSLLGAIFVFIMVTLFQRLKIHYDNSSVKPLDHLQKSILGSQLAKQWYNSGHQRAHFLEMTRSEEDDGTFRVLSYPDFYCPDIDKLIVDYYTKITRPPRKRIDPKLAYSSKLSRK